MTDSTPRPSGPDSTPRPAGPDADWHDLKFHRELYAGEAVDEAVQRYRKHIEVEMHELPDVWHLRLRSLKPGLTRRVAHELANYALGLTIQRGGPA